MSIHRYDEHEAELKEKAARRSLYEVAYLGGRRVGNAKDHPHRFHALRTGAESAFCGRRFNGMFSTWVLVEGEQAVTCPVCIRRVKSWIDKNKDDK
jgi:hypothetical protein